MQISQESHDYSRLVAFLLSIIVTYILQIYWFFPFQHQFENDKLLIIFNLFWKN